MLTTIRVYYLLTKPGIIRGNIMTALAGFLLAAQGSIELLNLLGMVIGLALVIAAGCVANNYIDRGIDARMERTRTRALVEGTIPGRAALLYAVILGLVGLCLLARLTNPLTALLAFIGFVAYVAVYGIAKRRTVHGTVVGSISGAIPPVVGYCAVTGRLDTAALLLFLILVSWQMPHFYAIALYRLKDYQSAHIPVLPAIRGVAATKQQMMVYICGFTVATAALTFFGYTTYFYLVVMLLASAFWLSRGLKGCGVSKQTARWARGMFGWSLLVLTIFCITLAIDSFIH